MAQRMPVIVTKDATAAAARAATVLANHIVAAQGARGRAVVAVSGGSTPWSMLRNLAGRALPWSAVHVVQVDERVAPDGDPDRNLTHLRECLAHVAATIHAMRVGSGEPEAAAQAYEQELAALYGRSAGPSGRAQPGGPDGDTTGRLVPVEMPVLDLVHLGLGEDGHTASLVPGDPVLLVRDHSVGVTEVYSGHRRVTLTYPVLAAARRVLWLATGEAKAEMVARLMAGDESVPAGSVPAARALLVADEAAAHLLPR